MSKGPYRKTTELAPVGAIGKIRERLEEFHNRHKVLNNRIKQTREWLISSLKANDFEVGEHDNTNAPVPDVFLYLEGLDRLWMEFQIPDKTRTRAQFKLDFTPVAQCEGYDWTTLEGKPYTAEMFYEDILSFVEKKAKTSEAD